MLDSNGIRRGGGNEVECLLSREVALAPTSLLSVFRDRNVTHGGLGGRLRLFVSNRHGIRGCHRTNVG